MLTRNQKGAIAEAKIAAEALTLGVPVLRPVAEHGRYDLAFDLGHRILRVQCKWASLKGDVVVVQSRGSWHSPGRGYVRTTYSADEVDAIAVYCGDLDACCLLPIERFAGQGNVHLRTAPPRNAQRASIHFLSDYTLRGAVAQLEERLTGSQEAGGSSPPSSTSVTPLPGSLQVGAHEFRNPFGWYMERAAAGEEIHVTRHGRPYVRLLGADDAR